MEFSISTDVARKYNDLKIGLVVVKKVDCGDYPKELETLKANREKYIKFNFRENQYQKVLAEHPYLASWREIYRSFGFDEGCSAEWLIRRTLDRGSLPKINKIVDICNIVAASNAIPIGGQDLDKILGRISLRLSPGKEPFIEIDEKKEKTKPGEVVYADDEKILCRQWNKADCATAKFTSETKRAILFVDGIGVISKEAVKETAKDLVGILNTFGATTEEYFIDAAGEISF